MPVLMRHLIVVVVLFAGCRRLFEANPNAMWLHDRETLRFVRVLLNYYNVG